MKPALISALFGLAFATAAHGQNAPDAGWSKDPATGCRFMAPRSLPSGPTYWTGDCTGGKASGLGVLRRRDGSVARQAFYGELSDGVPVLGVIDLTDGDQGGLMYGRWKDGDLVIGKNPENDEPVWQDKVDAFESARLAAREVSKRFKAQNNAASARYYTEQAEMLDDQLDN